MSRSTATATSTCATGATTGFCVFDFEGIPITTLIGDAHELSKWGKPESVERQPRHDEGAASGEEPRAAMALLLPDGGRFRSGDQRTVIVADSQRNRLQVYNKVRDYTDFQANL